METRRLLSVTPKDGITRVRFAPDKPLLAVSSWDENVYVYNTAEKDPDRTFIASLPLHNKPIFSVDWVSDATIVSGGADGNVLTTSVGKRATSLVGRHAAPVREVCVLPSNRNIVISGSWDSHVAAWDIRTAAPIPSTHEIARIGSPPPLSKIAAGGKIFCMDVRGSRVLLGLSSRTVQMWDCLPTNDLGSSPLFKQVLVRESPLRHQTRSVAIVSDIGNQFCLGSLEGRIAVDNVAGPDRYAFRCHRHQDPQANVFVSYPINAIKWCGWRNALFTGGSDGDLYLWNLQSRKRLFRLCESSGIASIDISSQEHDTIALGLSYTWENGWDFSRKNATSALHDTKIVCYSVSEFFPKDDKAQEGHQ
ncbi:putative WD-repeat family protein [Giardia duodenalis]|uniref:WD-repeat family protein n=1 Tax=Giardia intestinalis (strain ATCC 50803 / WB clone C6) TaxID=184922 RepID=A8B1Y9_GIAIC|nr:putative WD-repeat family protein [Giardia intestinalis]KAE8302889.1 putative WD-repeat family protein [Giardia intestinalis]|eukprot:XP_001709865.1 BUB3 [Giardia lamblia ATCC 50803]